MLEGLFYGDSFVSPTRLSAFDFSSVGSCIDRQTIEFLAVSDLVRFRSKPELLLHPLLDFKVCGSGAHGSEIIIWASIRAMS